jgi:hypothetical protein
MSIFGADVYKVSLTAGVLVDGSIGIVTLTNHFPDKVLY